MKILPRLFHPGESFRPGREVVWYLSAMLCFSLAAGCFGGVMANYLAEVVGLDEKGRSVLEFFRETPGLLLMVVLALLARRDEWWILRLGLFLAAIGMAGLLLAPPLVALVTVIIMVWSLGEHLLMPVRSSITMHLAKPGQEGGALGVAGGIGSLGGVMGALVAVGIFHWARAAEWAQTAGFHTAFAVSLALLAAGFAVTLRIPGQGGHVKRPRLHFHRKYNKFYMLEVFYGARKQVFITFAPYMLIRLYGMPTEQLALLVGICAALNIVGAPVAGWIVDRLGYRTVMIWDTVLLMVVCLMYGYAYHLFSPVVAFWVVCGNFVLDTLITNASSATNVYVRGISESREELTATLSTGISVNHLISILVALAGGWLVVAVCGRQGFTVDGMRQALAAADPAAKNALAYGYGVLFSISAFMALMNTLFALTIPKPAKQAKAA
ncbi:MAG: MFS transporter [Kiritimatiellaeota bacterium]|nr:MFS transporter [Kiritimatiellota bacterium]